MAASQRRYQATLPTEPAWPVRKRAPDRAHLRKAVARRRLFAMFVVVPVLLMLGSVYLHTVAAGLDTRAAELGVKLDRAGDQGERLKVRVAELSGAGRIRELAAERLGMHEPGSDELKVHANEAEDGTKDGVSEEGGNPRQR